MKRDIAPDIFVNDGSFMEKFNRLQQEKKQKASIDSSPSLPDSNLRPKTVSLLSNRPLNTKASEVKKSGIFSSSGKLVFSLKRMSKVVMSAVKLDVDEDDEGKDRENESNEGQVRLQKLRQSLVSESSERHGDVANDNAMKNVANKLACFVAKNGRLFEDITRQKNPGDTPFKFLFDPNSSAYKYYENRLLEEEKALLRTDKTKTSLSDRLTTHGSQTLGMSERSHLHDSNYLTSASALYEKEGEISASSSASDPIALMDYYMKKAAQEERIRQPKLSKDEMPPPDSLHESARKGSKGHHMGDYIPPEELKKFLANCNDAYAQKALKESAEKAKIQADNVGHKLLSKMGWKEGEGLGSFKSGRSDPVMSGDVKLNNLGVGAEKHGEVKPDDDIYEQYKKRMILGYRHRPNPLNNPRKAYY